MRWFFRKEVLIEGVCWTRDAYRSYLMKNASAETKTNADAFVARANLSCCQECRIRPPVQSVALATLSDVTDAAPHPDEVRCRAGGLTVMP